MDDGYGILSQEDGLVVRQVTQHLESVAQTVGVPYERKNKYKVSALPFGKHVAQSPSDPQRWKPTSVELEALDKMLIVKEESGMFNRLITTICGCSNARALELNFMVDPNSGNVFVVRRDFRCGGCIGCPWVMNGFENQGGKMVQIGRVREDFDDYYDRCFDCCCKCTYYHHIETKQPGNETFEKAYRLRASLCVCGRVNNCCGGTCCKNDQVFDILDKDDEVVAHIQRTYGPGPGACCRCCYMFNNYILKFPSDSSPEERILILTSIFQMDYQLFEKGGEN